MKILNNQTFQILDGFVSTESSILFDAKFRTFLQQKMVENKAKGLVIGFPFEDGVMREIYSLRNNFFSSRHIILFLTE